MASWPEAPGDPVKSLERLTPLLSSELSRTPVSLLIDPAVEAGFTTGAVSSEGIYSRSQTPASPATFLVGPLVSGNNNAPAGRVGWTPSQGVSCVRQNTAMG